MQNAQDKHQLFVDTLSATSDQPGQGTFSLHGALPLLSILLTSDVVVYSAFITNSLETVMLRLMEGPSWVPAVTQVIPIALTAKTGTRTESYSGLYRLNPRGRRHMSNACSD